MIDVAHFDHRADSDTASGQGNWFVSSDGSAGGSAPRSPSVSGRFIQVAYPLHAPKEPPEKRPKYDPHNARHLWQPEALAVTSKPRKRPRKQVEYNQVSGRRAVRPRYLSRKR